jgi:ABC-type multidrug transport system ATPase subunit
MTTYALQSHDLVKTYNTGISLFGKKVNAVNGLSLNVPEGSIYGLLGRNSAGKTTSIRIARGLALPTAGTMQVFGLDHSHDPGRVAALEQVGYVPEARYSSPRPPSGVFWNLTGLMPSSGLCREKAHTTALE